MHTDPCRNGAAPRQVGGGDAPEPYREVLGLLRAAVASGCWPATSAARGRVIYLALLGAHGAVLKSAGVLSLFSLKSLLK